MTAEFDRLIALRHRTHEAQSQLSACYRRLVNQVLDDEMTNSEDIYFLYRSIQEDVHSHELCWLMRKIDYKMTAELDDDDESIEAVEEKDIGVLS